MLKVLPIQTLANVVEVFVADNNHFHLAWSALGLYEVSIVYTYVGIHWDAQIAHCEFPPDEDWQGG